MSTEEANAQQEKVVYPKVEVEVEEEEEFQVSDKEKAKVEEFQVSDKEKKAKVKEDVKVSDKEKKAKVEKAKWGTHIMGPPAAPSAHPQNQEAATWKAQDGEYDNSSPSPYFVKEEPVQPKSKPNSNQSKSHKEEPVQSKSKPNSNKSKSHEEEPVQSKSKPNYNQSKSHEEEPVQSKSPMETVLHSFNKWTKQAEVLASNVWINLKTGQSLPDAAWGKLSLGAKAFTEGGFEPLFKQTFSVDPEEKLRKTYASYLSTSTGPVAGTLYVSTLKIAFCSDRPLSFTIPSGEDQWSYYRVAIPLVKLKLVNPSVNKDNPAQKYIQVVTVDNYEFWFMGFVNHDKALSTLQESVAQSHDTSSLPRQ